MKTLLLAILFSNFSFALSPQLLAIKKDMRSRLSQAKPLEPEAFKKLRILTGFELTAAKEAKAPDDELAEVLLLATYDSYLSKKPESVSGVKGMWQKYLELPSMVKRPFDVGYLYDLFDRGNEFPVQFANFSDFIFKNYATTPSTALYFVHALSVKCDVYIYLRRVKDVKACSNEYTKITHDDGEKFEKMRLKVLKFYFSSYEYRKEFLALSNEILKTSDISQVTDPVRRLRLVYNNLVGDYKNFDKDIQTIKLSTSMTLEPLYLSLYLSRNELDKAQKILKDVEEKSLRFFRLTTHYQSMIEYNFKRKDYRGSQQYYEKLLKFEKRKPLDDLPIVIEKYVLDFLLNEASKKYPDGFKRFQESATNLKIDDPVTLAQIKLGTLLSDPKFNKAKSGDVQNVIKELKGYYYPKYYFQSMLDQLLEKLKRN